MDVQQLEYQAPLLESPRARPGKPPVAPEADLARGDRDWSLIDALRQREPIAAERQDAEDVIQDAFWSVVRKIDSFRGAAPFGSWLYRIVVNAPYHTRRRGHGRRRDRALAEASPVFDRDGRHQGAVADWSARLDNPSAQSELRLVLTAIDELPPEYRTLVVLRDVEGLSHRARSPGSPSPARRPVSTGRGSFSASNSPNTWPRRRAGLAPTQAKE